MSEEDQERALFSTLDYAIFVIVLAASALIGVYYGFISKRKQNNTAEYLLGGKSMSIFPVSLSLIASHVSGVSLLGTPSEMYQYGTQYAVCFTCCLVVVLAMWFIYLPVFHELQMTSCFLYLEKRFCRKVRLTASFFYTLAIILLVPVITYAPGIAFSQVTGVNLHFVTPITILICVFYTTFGGLRAVVWTDAFQFVLMLGATLVVIYLGLDVTGGFANVWEAAERGKRLIFFNMDPNPFVRSSFWTVSIGLSTLWISMMGVNQSSMQRFLAVPDLRRARQTLIYFSLGQLFIKGCCILVGLIIFAKYESCDPFAMKKIKKMDQILPFFVMDVGRIPGLPGLFIAGIFSAALSTMSSCWNTLAGTIYEDFLRNRMPNATEERASNIMKLIVVILGAITLGLVYVVEKMGTVFSFTITIQGLTAGTMLGIFTFGMICRKGNTKGVISGALTAFVIIAIISVGAKRNKYPGLVMRTDGCSANETMIGTESYLLHRSWQPGPSDPHEDIFILFKLSNMYYTFLGTCICFAVAYVVSVLTGGYEVKDERLFTPLVRIKKVEEKELREIMKNTEYLNIEEANKAVETRS